MKFNFSISILLILLLGSCSSRPAFEPGKDFDFADYVKTVPTENVMLDSAWNIWCGSMVKGTDNKYHLFYSRWPRSTGHESWISHSEIAYAVADKPEGPYKPVNVALGQVDSVRWDGAMAHNPCIVLKDDTYYLYYIATKGRPLSPTELLSPYGHEWWTRRNTQRVGVAVSDNPAGPWKRLPQPVLSNNEADTTAFDAMCVTNPAVCVGRDGKMVMLYKAVCKDGRLQGGHVRFSVAFADSPTGPFVKTNKLIFQPKDENARMVAEDPYIWYSKQNDMYYAVVRDVIKEFTGKESGGLALMQSKDALEWTPAAHPKVLPPTLHWSDGTTYEASEYNVERPWLYCDETGKPCLLFGTIGLNLNGIHREFSYNARIPFQIPD